MDINFAEKFITTTTPASAHRSFVMAPGDEAEFNRKQRDVSSGGEKAVSEIVKEMQKNERIAHFEEIKINTEVALGVF